MEKYFFGFDENYFVKVGKFELQIFGKPGDAPGVKRLRISR